MFIFQQIFDIHHETPVIEITLLSNDNIFSIKKKIFLKLKMCVISNPYNQITDLIVKSTSILSPYTSLSSFECRRRLNILNILIFHYESTTPGSPFQTAVQKMTSGDKFLLFLDERWSCLSNYLIYQDYIIFLYVIHTYIIAGITHHQLLHI